MPSAFLVLGFGSILLAGILLTSSLRNLSIGQILEGITSPEVGTAQATLGANVPGEQSGGSAGEGVGGKNAPSPLAAGKAGLTSSTQLGIEKRTVQQISRNQKWSAGDWEKIIELESGWSSTATNPSSGAFGVGQFLGSTKAEYKAQGSESTNPVKQIVAMGDYIKNRYGTPEKALAFHLQHGWY